MSLEMTQDESEILCRMLKHNRLDYPVTKIEDYFFAAMRRATRISLLKFGDPEKIRAAAEDRASRFVASMFSRGFVEPSICGPRVDPAPGSDPEIRPAAIALTAYVAALAEVVAEIPAEGGPMRWIDRGEAIAIRREREGLKPPRFRAYNETDLLARQVRQGSRAEGLDGQADHRTAGDLDDGPDDGRIRRPWRLLGIGAIWDGPTPEGEECPVCHDRIPPPQIGEPGTYCLKCESLGGEKPREWRRKKRRAG